MRFTFALFIVALLLLPASVAAQAPPECAVPAENPVNPTRVCFIASSDHPIIDAYALDIFDMGGGLINTIDLGLPTPDANNWISWDMLNVMPVGFGLYFCEVRALGGGVSSSPSDPSNNWDRAPGRPGGPVSVVGQ